MVRPVWRLYDCCSFDFHSSFKHSSILFLSDHHFDSLSTDVVDFYLHHKTRCLFCQLNPLSHHLFIHPFLIFSSRLSMKFIRTIEKNVSSVHSNGSNNGAALSLTQPSMLRENTLNRDTSFTFGSTPSVSETPGQVEMPQLSRNHSLFGYLEVPSMTRNQSLSRAYDDPFGASPRGA